MDVKDHIKKITARDKELNYRANKTKEYLDVFCNGTKKAYGELIKELSELDVARLKEIHILKIADIMPKTIDELKIVLQGYTVSLNNDNLKKIVSVVKKY
jgi:DNA-directed RNA polymerase subunit F